MKPLLLPMAERLGRKVLIRRGAKSRSVRTSLGNLHVYDVPGRGELAPTVLLHGLGSGGTPFGRLLGRLSRDVRRVVVPDLLGHGFSDACSPDVTPGDLFSAATEALDALLTEPVVLVGNSLGGAVAMHFALARPEKVKALVLVSPAGAQATDEEWEQIRALFDVRSRKEASAFLRRLYHEPPWFAPLVVHEFPAALARPTMRRLLDTASNRDAFAPESLASLSMPILLLWGQSDRLLPERHFEYFARHLPPQTVVDRPAGLGHCPHFDSPDELAARIVSFVRTATASAPPPSA